MLVLPGEEGQGLLEYALIILLVAVAVVAIVLLLGPYVGDLYSNVNSSWQSATGG